MAPTDGRVARPERQWGCRRGTPSSLFRRTDCAIAVAAHLRSSIGTAGGGEELKGEGGSKPSLCL